MNVEKISTTADLEAQARENGREHNTLELVLHGLYEGMVVTLKMMGKVFKVVVKGVVRNRNGESLVVVEDEKGRRKEMRFPKFNRNRVQ